MISFNCIRCGRTLSAEDDRAGSDLQCTACGVLNSIPLPSDLGSLNEDGTIRIVEFAPTYEPNRLRHLARTYGKSKIDAETGEEIDNRTLAEALELAPIVSAPQVSRPQYDPETGELVKPLELTKLPPIPALPVSSVRPDDGRTIAYASPGRTESIGRSGVWLQLFEPQNAMVMVVIALTHLLAGLILPFIMMLFAILFAVGLPKFPLWILNLLFWLVVAHYGNVVEDTGPEERDELPRPLRQLSYSEDVFSPFVHVLAAFCISYGPALIALHAPDKTLHDMAGPILILCGLLFPAVLMTLCCSKSLANLRPDRLVRVVASSGWGYWRIAILSAIFVPIYIETVLAAEMVSPIFRGTALGDRVDAALSRSFVTTPLALVGLYVLHGVCWRLGQMFRQHGSSFGWRWEVYDRRLQEDRYLRHEEKTKAKPRQPSPSSPQDLPHRFVGM